MHNVSAHQISGYYLPLRVIATDQTASVTYYTYRLQVRT